MHTQSLISLWPMQFLFLMYSFFRDTHIHTDATAQGYMQEVEDMINYTVYLKDMVQQVTDNHIIYAIQDID